MTINPLGTLVGKKILVAITGLFMLLFVIMHLIGNLQIYAGPEAINEYAAFLASIPKIVWLFRITMILAIIMHIWLTISLTKTNCQARQEKYFIPLKTSFFAKTMIWSGLTVLAFIIYHLAHYTLCMVRPEFALLSDGYGRHHVYNMIVMGFSSPLVSLFYIVAQILLASHLSHGIASSQRTLGLSMISYEKMQIIGISISILIALLYVSIPLSVLVGILPLDL